MTLDSQNAKSLGAVVLLMLTHLRWGSLIGDAHAVFDEVIGDCHGQAGFDLMG
jgi:hypothetical protein